MSQISAKFPELAIFVPNDGPAGPFPTASFEVDLLTPAQLGAFLPWILINHGNLSVLVHPNTDGAVETDHLESAVWIGKRWPLDVAFFERMRARKTGKGEVGTR